MHRSNLAAVAILAVPSLAASAITITTTFDAQPSDAPIFPSTTTRSVASSSIITLLLPDFEDQHFLASIITANPTATSYLVVCPTDVLGFICGPGAAGFRVLEGPSTWELHMGPENGFTYDLSCSLNGDQADCDIVQNDSSGKTVIVTRLHGMSTWGMPVTVTAGLESLTSYSSGAITSGSGGGGGSGSVIKTASSESTHAPTGNPAPGNGTGTAGSAPISTVSRAGMAAVTGHAVVAGFAAVLGGLLVA